MSDRRLRELERAAALGDEDAAAALEIERARRLAVPPVLYLADHDRAPVLDRLRDEQHARALLARGARVYTVRTCDYSARSCMLRIEARRGAGRSVAYGYVGCRTREHVIVGSWSRSSPEVFGTPPEDVRAARQLEVVCKHAYREWGLRAWLLEHYSHLGYM